MRRQLYSGGGITRQNFGLGSWLKKRIRKLIPNELASVASRAAPFVSMIPGWGPLAGGIMRGVGRFDKRGSMSDALKQGLGTWAGGEVFGRGMEGLNLRDPGAEGWREFINQPTKTRMGGIFGRGETQGKDITTGKKSTYDTLWEDQTVADRIAQVGTQAVEKTGDLSLKGIMDKWNSMSPGMQTAIVGTGSGALAGIAQWFENQIPQEEGESMDEYLARRKIAVGKLMRQYMDNTRAYDPAWTSMTDQQKDETVAQANMNQGGRVGYQTGGISMGNTLAQNIAANQAQAARVNQIIQQARTKLPSAAQAPAGITSLTQSFQPETRSQARTQLFGGPPSGGSTTVAPRPVVQTGFQTPGPPPPMLGMGGMNPEDFMQLSEAEQMKRMDADVAREEADMKKYGNFYTQQGSTPRTIDPIRGKIAYRDILQALKMDYPEAYANLTGNETLEELDELSGQLAGYWSKGGRVGLFGGGEAGDESLDAGAPDITYEGNEGPKAPMKMAGMRNRMSELMIKLANGTITEEEMIELRNIESASGFSRANEAKGPVLPSPEDPINPWAPKPTGPALPDREIAAQGGRIGYRFGPGPVMAQAGLPGIPRRAPDGLEYDMSENGGFQPLGAKEGKDDVKANLAKNEFVFTADAVRGAGGGDIELGAQRMYDTMKNLERRMA